MRLPDRVRAHRPLVVILAIGLVVRVVVMATFTPAFLAHPGIADTELFVGSAAGDLYGDPTRPVGYPLFLRLISGAGVQGVIAIQHLLGLVTAAVLYAAARRLGGSQTVALVPAGIVALNGDQVFLEHTVLSEALFTLLVAAVLYAAVRVQEGAEVRWALVLGTLIGAAMLVRSVGIVLGPVVAGWLLLFGPRPAPRRLPSVVMALAVVGILLGADAALRSSTTDYSGFSPTAGRSLYARVAQFADCKRFEPPRGTRRLCESVPTRNRPGPSHYFSFPESPAVRAYGPPPGGDAELRSFARAAVAGQPLVYATEVMKDMVRYVDPDRPARQRSGLGPSSLSFDQRPTADEQFGAASVAELFGEVEFRRRGGASAPGDYQTVMRVHGPLLALAFLVAIAGSVAGTGRDRPGIVLSGAIASGLLVLPLATLIYGARYSVPALGPLAMSVSLSLAALTGRVRNRRRA